MIRGIFYLLGKELFVTSIRSSLLILSVTLLCSEIGCSPSTGGDGKGGSSDTSAPTMHMASLQNKAGKFVKPTIESGQKALAGAKLPDDLIAWASDPEGDGSYPIVTYTWIIAYKKYADAKKGNALKDVLDVLSQRWSERKRGVGLHTAAGECHGQGERGPGQHCR